MITWFLDRMAQTLSATGKAICRICSGKHRQVLSQIVTVTRYWKSKIDTSEESGNGCE